MSRVEVQWHFKNKAVNFPTADFVTINLDWKDYTISEIKTEAIKKAKEFLFDAAKS